MKLFSESEQKLETGCWTRQSLAAGKQEQRAEQKPVSLKNKQNKERPREEHSRAWVKNLFQ